VDCGNGVAGPFAPDILERLGCQVFRYACRPLGSFPHGGSDPSVPKNLSDLAEIVTVRGYDVGVGLDPDGDRLGVVDEKGAYVPIEKVAFLIAKDILGGWERIFKKEKRFVCDVRSLLGFRTAVERLGGKVEMIPAGRSFFRQELFENPDILLGVEASGHIHISDNFYGFDDGIFAAARLLQILSKSRKPLSKLVSEFPLSFHTPEIKIPCPDEKKFALVEKVKQNFAQKYDTIEVDGVRAKLDEKSWFLVRAKNTGPYLSLRFEADTKEKVLEMVRVVAKELEKFTEIDDSWRDEIEVVG
jgi:phosphomannomutase/phosphoglucomutase